MQWLFDNSNPRDRRADETLDDLNGAIPSIIRAPSVLAIRAFSRPNGWDTNK